MEKPKILAVYEIKQTEQIVVLMEKEDGETAWETGDKIEFLSEEIPDLEEEEEEQPGAGNRALIPKIKKEKTVKVKPAGKKKPFTLDREYDTSENDIKMIRKWFSMWKRDDMFSENQISAINVIGGRFYKTMTDEMKDQMLSIFNEVRKKVQGK